MYTSRFSIPTNRNALIRVAILCLLLLSGCGTATSIPTIFDEQESKLPSKVWKDKVSGGAIVKTKVDRDSQAKIAIQYVDDLYFKHYEMLINEPDRVSKRERGFQIAQWVGTTVTALLSWKANQSNGQQDDDSGDVKIGRHDISYNDLITVIGISTAAATGFNALLNKWDNKEDKNIDITPSVKARRVVRECIQDALRSKTLLEYTLEDLMEDLDNYYRAGGLSASAAVPFWKLNCS